MENDSKKYNEILINKFPSLKVEFYKFTDELDGIKTGSIVVYEDVFIPYVIKQLNDNNVSEINKITEFIEELLNSSDEYAFNIAYIAILESLKSDDDGKKIKDYLKEKSLKEYNELIY